MKLTKEYFEKRYLFGMNSDIEILLTIKKYNQFGQKPSLENITEDSMITPAYVNLLLDNMERSGLVSKNEGYDITSKGESELERKFKEFETIMDVFEKHFENIFSSSMD